MGKRKLSGNCCVKLTSTHNNCKANESFFSINNKKCFKVGRDPSCCQIIFTNTPMVSRVHCEFIFNQNNELFVKDLKSTNGVFVNNASVDKQGALQQIFDGDIVRFGKRSKSFNHEYRIEIIQTVDVQAIIQQTTAKNEELNRMKQELNEKANQQRLELEAKQKEFERMKEKMEIDKLQNAQKLREEKQRLEMEKESALKEANERIKKKEQETKQKELEALQKIKEIEETEKRLNEERKREQLEMKQHKEKMEEEAAEIKKKEIAYKEEEKKL